MAAGADGRRGRAAAPSGQEPNVRIRRARPSDVAGIYACQAAAYPHLPAAGLNDERAVRLQIKTFPEGQFVAVADKRIVAYAASLIVTLDEESPWYSYAEITGNGTFTTHDPAGDTLYGADIGVHPDWRGRGIAQRLYERRRRLMRRLNLRRFVAGGRIPGYRAYAKQYTAVEYVQKVVEGELTDPTLSAQLKAGLRVRGVHPAYMRDSQSLDYATFLEIENPDYRPEHRQIAASPVRGPVRKVRVCAAQYQMRPLRSWDDFEYQVDFFVRTAEEYYCHLLLLPELFTAQLFSLLESERSGPEAIAWLADHTDRYLELFKRFAKRSGLLIVAGSHPVRTPTGIRNVAHLVTPSGNVYTQDKLHVTPNEQREYGIVPGEGLQVFDTPYGRWAILVCYDIEFPELARILAMAGAEVLLVPFSTDERKAYMRVRYSSHARAVENMVYVVLSGNVGNLPRVDNFLINYGQSAVLTPSDFPFPAEAVAATVEPNFETVVITDLDLGSITQVREMGSVRTIADRRTDLYRLDALAEVEIIRVV